jgi:hypothetical protein
MRVAKLGPIVLASVYLFSCRPPHAKQEGVLSPKSEQSSGTPKETAPREPSGSVPSNETQQMVNYEAPGNLASTQAVACGPLSSLNNTMTPADLYPAMAECVASDRVEEGVRIFALAGIYARFDMLRVADNTAHQAEAVLQINYLGDLSEAAKAKFAAQLDAIADDPRRLSELCHVLRNIGSPQYHPTYMIQHGMGAFTGSQTPDGLVAGFDPKKAWEDSLTSYMHCPPAEPGAPL